MSALAPEPPALVRSLEEGQHRGHEPGHVLAQLSAALENPDIKALEWSKDGRGVRVHAELYEEEMVKNKELFPELADLGCVAALRAWLLAYGFKLKKAKANLQVLMLQHPDFQRARPTAKGPGTLGGDAGPSVKQQKKRKKTKHASRGATSQDTPGLLQPMSEVLAGKGLSASNSSCTSLGQRRRRRKRPLYEYINYDMPELMHPSAGEPSPATPGRAAAPQLEDTWARSAPEMPAPEEGDECMQIDIDSMLRHAAHLVPLLFPQYK